MLSFESQYPQTRHSTHDAGTPPRVRPGTEPSLLTQVAGVGGEGGVGGAGVGAGGVGGAGVGAGGVGGAGVGAGGVGGAGVGAGGVSLSATEHLPLASHWLQFELTSLHVVPCGSVFTGVFPCDVNPDASRQESPLPQLMLHCVEQPSASI